MSAFDSITIEGAATSAPPAQAGGSAFDSIRIVDAPKRAPEPPSGGVAGAVRNLVGGTADVVDLVFAGTPAMVLGTFAEGVNRLQGAVSGKPRKQVAEEGAALSAGIGQAFGTPLRTTLTNLGYLRKDEPGAIQQGMDAVMGLVERDAKAIEERTGGKVLKEDVLMLVNGLMAAAGTKGIGYGTGKVLEARQAKAAALELDKFAQEKRGLNTLEAEADAAKTTTPVKDASTAGLTDVVAASERDLAMTEKQRKAERNARRAEVRAAFAEDPVGATRTERLVEGDLERRAAAEAERTRLSNMGERAPRTGLREGQPLDQITPMARPVTTPGPEPFSTAEQMATQRGLQGRGLADTMGRGDQGPLVAPTSTLDSALAKTRRGQLFDLTPEERIALKGASAKVVDPKIATAAIVGATGLGLAMALEPSAEEAALAIGAGALVAGRGRGLTLEALRTMPDATPLGRILDQSAYTLSTLEMLPKNRFEFGKDSVAQLLKRDSVTKAERAILQDVLDATPGETITAKRLMEGVKARTGDFELKRAESDEFASYGLERIDRATADDYEFRANTPEETRAAIAEREADLPEMQRRAAAPEETRFEDYPYGARQAQHVVQTITNELEELRTKLNADENGTRPETPTTTIYQSPVELGTANHFGDPNYFAHTRSFVEDGVKHVVELQSDVAQKAGKVLTEGERAVLQNELQGLGGGLGDVLNDIAGKSGVTLADLLEKRLARMPEPVQTRFQGLAGIDHINAIRHLRHENKPHWGQSELGQAVARAFKSLADEVSVRRQELNAKLTEAAGLGAISPMLKDWHKRLVREELASAARESDPAARQRQLEYYRRELAAAEAAVAEASRPREWTRVAAARVENLKYELDVAAMDLRNEHTSERAVRQRMLEIEKNFAPEVRARWEAYWEANADEMADFLRPGQESGTWGRYSEAFPRAMSKFLDSELGNVGVDGLKHHADQMKSEVARWEKLVKAPSVVRFADADTVAKVEGWPEESTTSAAKRAGMQDVWERDYEVQAPRILRQHESRLRSEARGDAEALAKIPRQMETAAANMKKARKYSKLFESPDHAGLYIFYKEDVTKFLKQLGAADKVDSAGHGWWEVPVEGSKTTPAGRRVQQFGGLDADLAKAVAVIGGGAALGSYLSDPENKLRGSIQGAIVGLAALAASRHPGFRDAAQAAGSAAEYGLGLASTRVRNISEGLHWRMVKHEGDVLKLSHDALAATEKFSDYLRKLPEAAKGQLNRDILSGDFAAVLRQLGANPAVIGEWQKVRATLADLGGRLKDAGKLRELLTDYYPRVVVDPEGLLAALGKEKRTYIDLQLGKARARAARMGQELSPLEISTIINRALKSQAQGTGKPGFLKKRSVQEITPELEPFYAPASESLPLYIRAVVREIERAKFFGENLVRDAETGVVDLDTSIGNLVQQERAKGGLSPAQEAELTSILRSRFGPGERSMNKYLQGLKNLSYAGLLGHVTSAIPQMADTAMAFYAHGFLPTVKAMQAVGKRAPDRVTVKDVGLADHVVEELTGGTAKPKTILGFQLSSAKFLQKSFKYSGFSLTDQFGKNVHLNAAWTKYRGWAKSAAGIERIRGKYGKALGPEFDSLVADLREGKLTDRTRTLLFAELSDMQPVSKLEVPQAYLDMPNGRVVYMLKTWMLKQADIVRRDIVQRAARGDKRGAFEAGLRFSLILGISGASVEAIKNLLLGREDPLELSDIPNNVLKTFALSEYTMDRVRQGKPLDAALNVALPPYKMWDEILARDPRAINYVPLVGRLVYADNMQALGISTGLHGAAKANLRAENRRKAEERRAEDPEGYEERRRRAKERYEERLRERETQ